MIQQCMTCKEVISEITQEVKVGGQGDIVLVSTWWCCIFEFLENLED